MEFKQIIFIIILIILTTIIIRLFLKRKIRLKKLINFWKLISDKFHEFQFLQIPEFNHNSQYNHLFHQISIYLNTLDSLENSNFTHLFSGENANDIVLTFNPNQTVVDNFLSADLRWSCAAVEGGDGRIFTLMMRKRDKRRVLRSYFDHIIAVSDEIDRRKRELRLFTAVSDGGWRRVRFTHPATMETIAMDDEVKSRVILDLETFLKSKSYYHRLGRIWRRSYLLYGPSGTGKSTFVSALAKTLSYDIYDFDLSKMSDDVDLKLMLLRTTSRSVLLIEDFDKYVAMKKDSSPRSLSSVMSFMDGVVNSCCDERVIVFTMMLKDEIDPVILRPGRVDVHVHFSMCDFNIFKSLASNYLGVKEHKLFTQVEELFISGVTLSPAEICELMIVNRNSPSRAIKAVISALQTTSFGGGVEGCESCKGTPKNGVKLGRVSVDGSRDSVDGGSGVGFRDGAKEFRKLYSLLRRKNSVSKSGSFDLGS